MQWVFLCGLVCSLIAWGLPVRLKPYHVRRWMDDWKIALVEHTHEYGLSRSGIVMGRFSKMYYARNPKLIGQLRTDWYEHLAQSKIPSPIDSAKLQYDEWGPSHWIRPDGVEITQVGSTYSLPYSLCATIFAGLWLVTIGIRSRRLHKQHIAGILA